MRVSEVVTTDEIKSWEKGSIVTIKAGTGAGKSYFIKNLLFAFAKMNNKKILMLIHRLNCVDQFQNEVERDGKTDTIEIKTYQSLENSIAFDFSEYDYIVCDEFHYFMSDAAFNKTTDISLNMILEQTDKTRIFMSATGDNMVKYINNQKHLDTIDYELEIDFNFIKELTFFSKDSTIEKFINEAIEKNQKGLFFIQSATRAYELYEKYKDVAVFNCGKGDKHYPYVDKKKIQSILKNEKFDELILITTTCMDAGVNIVDDELKHVVCDISDVATLTQCIGRKRLVNKDDHIYLYVKTITNQQLGGFQTQLNKKRKMAQFLMNHTVQEYIEKYPREYDKYNLVYDEIIEGETDKATKKVNDLMYFKCLIDCVEMDNMKTYGEFGYCKYLANKFGFSDYRLIEEEESQNELVQYLESIVGEVMLTAPDRKELIEKLNVKQDGKLLKSLNSLNSALQEQNFNYYIKQFETSRIEDGKKKKYKSAWKVLKLVEK